MSGNAEVLLRELAGNYGLGTLSLSKGMCQLIFDDRIAVDFALEPEGREMAMAIVLGRPKAGTSGAIEDALLRANAAWGDTGLGFGLVEHTGEAVVFSRFDARGATLALFAEAVERLLETADAWKKRIDDDLETDRAASPAPEFGTGLWA